MFIFKAQADEIYTPPVGSADLETCCVWSGDAVPDDIRLGMEWWWYPELPRVVEALWLALFGRLDNLQ